VFFYLFSFLFIFSCAIRAYSSVDISGYVENETRAIIDKEKSNDLTKNESLLDLKFETSPSDTLEGYAELKIRYFAFSGEDYPYFSKENRITSDYNLLEDVDTVNQVILELKEAYITKYDFLVKGVDFIIGKRIIKWGTADGINPSDNINPPNLEYPLSFKDKLGVNALELRLNFSEDVVLAIVGVPSFTPPVMPLSIFNAIIEEKLSSALPSPPQNGFDYEVDLPERNMKESGKAGARFSFKLFNTDFSLGYLYTRDNFPVVYKMEITSTTPPAINSVKVYYTFPYYHIGSFDFSTELFEIGFWGEVAAFFPEDINQEKVFMGTNSYPLLDKEHPFVRWIAGMDYTFANGLYVNFQYLHGFFMERRHYDYNQQKWVDDLGDYLIFRIEKKFFEDTLKISVASIYEVRKVAIDMFKDDRDIKTAYMINPEVIYMPEDNLKFILGCFIIDGDKDTTLYGFSNIDEGYFKVSLYF